MPIVLAHRLPPGWLRYGRGHSSWVRPDGKSQVTVEYRNGKPIRIDTIVVSTQHSPTSRVSKLSAASWKVIKPVMPKGCTIRRA